MKSKYIISAILIVFVAVSLVFLIKQETKTVNPNIVSDSTVNEENATPKTVVYYFHSSKRCMSCNFIEEQTVSAINENFTDQLKNKELEIRIVNVSEPENRHFIDEYELITQSVVLVEKKGNADIRQKKLEEVWDFVGDIEPFKNYIYNETKNFISRV